MLAIYTCNITFITLPFSMCIRKVFITCPFSDAHTGLFNREKLINQLIIFTLWPWFTLIIDYCNSLYYNLPKSQINRLQLIQNCLARTVVKAPKSSLVTTILRSLHWLKINERIEYKLLSLTYKVLTTIANQTTYTIWSLFSLQVELAPHLLSP